MAGSLSALIVGWLAVAGEVSWRVGIIPAVPAGVRVRLLVAVATGSAGRPVVAGIAVVLEMARIVP